MANFAWEFPAMFRASRLEILRNDGVVNEHGRALNLQRQLFAESDFSVARKEVAES
jgi:hypothetical protein